MNTPANRPETPGFPVVSFKQINGSSGASAYCRGCNTKGYAADEASQAAFRRNHKKCEQRKS